MTFTYHVLGLAHIPTSKKYLPCAYTQKIVNLIKMLKSFDYNKVILYCDEESETLADEQVTCVTKEIREKTYGKYDWKTDFFKHDGNDLAYTTFNRNAIDEILKRRDSERDFLLCPFGNYQKPVADAFNFITVETGIGYSGIFSNFKVFESCAWMHYIYGQINQINGNFYDTVIPNYYDLADFPHYNNKKQDYYLYIGRLISRKGFKIAVEVTNYLNKKLLVVGQGNLKNVDGEDFSNYKNIEHIGTITDPIIRSKIYSEAIATFVPTLYIGPFEGVAVESQLSGTPVITTQWGVFNETVIQNKTGFRCRTFKDFVDAAIKCQNLNPLDCRQWAENFSIDKIKYQYDKYFKDLYNLWDKGWYQI